MTLDLTPYRSAITQLDASLQHYRAHATSELSVFLRAACIQAFEYTYELSWKMLKRYLQLEAPDSADIDMLSFAQLIRTGNERGLLKSEIVIWRTYRANRNMTSHTYNEATAETVFAAIPDFLMDAKFLLTQLEQRI